MVVGDPPPLVFVPGGVTTVQSSRSPTVQAMSNQVAVLVGLQN
jgi:hypothetical protein